MKPTMAVTENRSVDNCECRDLFYVVEVTIRNWLRHYADSI